VARRAGAAALCVLVGCGLAACGSSPPAALKASQIISVDQASETVHLKLIASATNSYQGFNFDGYGGGAMDVRIPVGWTVDVYCENDSTVLTHSCAITDNGPVSPNGGPLAFPGASTPNATSGLAFGIAASFTFTATRVGTFRINCLVTGHEADGMWDWLTVTSGGRPRVTT
jgi:hypothetical protein